MRIGLDGRLYRSATGGIGRYSQELIKNLLTIDQENKYVLFLTEEDKAECELKASNLERVVTNIRHFTLAEQVKLPKLLDNYELDLVHFLNFNHPIFYGGPFVTTIHDLTMNFFPAGRQSWPILRQAYNWVMGDAVRRSKAVIVPTNKVKQDILANYPATGAAIEVIYEGVELPRSKQPVNSKLKQLAISKPYLLFVSQWRPHKGLVELLMAFDKIKKIHDVQLVITGRANPQFPAIPRAIEQSEHRKDIITPGFVDDKTLDSLYRNATLFVFPSFYEGFGLGPVEAMARGTPVASSNLSVMPEVLGRAAVYFNPQKNDEMARIITNLLSDRAKLSELRRKSKVQAQKYSWQKTAAATLKLYRKVISNG